MKIHINRNPSAAETEITITCAAIDADIERLVSVLGIIDRKLTGVRDRQTFILAAENVYYIESVDKRTFIYTDGEYYESALRLYELEEQLSAVDFLRANKSCILNFNKIKSFRADIDGKLLVTMDNGEKLAVSRQYAPDFKKKLGVK